MTGTSPWLHREAREAAAARAHALQHELQEARAEAEERSREVAQLREVSIQADQALQQCMAQLQVPAQRAPASTASSLSCLQSASAPPIILGSIVTYHLVHQNIPKKPENGRRMTSTYTPSWISRVLIRDLHVTPEQALMVCTLEFHILQALQADAEAKAGMLNRAAEAQQCAQAEAERTKRAYDHERDNAKALQEESTSWKSKVRKREEVCLLDIMLSYVHRQKPNASSRTPWYSSPYLQDFYP